MTSTTMCLWCGMQVPTTEVRDDVTGRHRLHVPPVGPPHRISGDGDDVMVNVAQPPPWLRSLVVELEIPTMVVAPEPKRSIFGRRKPVATPAPEGPLTFGWEEWHGLEIQAANGFPSRSSILEDVGLDAGADMPALLRTVNPDFAVRPRHALPPAARGDEEHW